MTNQEALIMLNAIPGIGNIKIPELIACFHTPQAVLLASHNQLVQTDIVSSKVAQNIVHFPQDEFLKQEQRSMKQQQVSVVTFQDKKYPLLLKEIPDPPVVLYVKGQLRASEELSLAIVGSRRASLYGRNIAHQFAMRLSDLGITVVSGMARGIDTSAHKGVLLAGGRTIAVLGSGLSEIYPRENEKLFEQISKQGAILSEFPMTTKPLAQNFPRRNRIISGLSLGVIVVEAALRSGALITANFALEQGKEVYAVPGTIDNPTASGVNNLIKQGAKLITSLEDVLEDLSLQLKTILQNEPQQQNGQEEKETLNDLTEQELLVYKYINNNIYLDEIIQKSGGTHSDISSILLHLEMKGFISKLPGNRFKKNKRKKDNGKKNCYS